MNPERTDFILLGTRQTLKKANGFQISVAGSSTKPSPSMRLLGVTIDSCLSWDAHIGQIIKKCNAILISLYRFRHHFNQETLKLLIETHVFSQILYCISVWGGAAKNQLFRIQKVINLALGSCWACGGGTGSVQHSSGISGMGQDRTAGAGERPTQNLQSSSLPTIPTVDSPYVYPSIQGWNFGRFLVLLGFRRLYSLSGKYSPSIPFPMEPEIPGTQSTRLRPQFHTESLIGKPKILKRQTHGITTKAYRSV